ncbi:MAG: type III-A CRISPR-associated RAMP protein Csm4 [Anaerolineae bacterium]
MDAKVYYLQARSAFHFGLRGVGIEETAVHAPSDTLFAALCYALLERFGRSTLEEFLAGFHDHVPPLLLSSTFPYVLARRERQVEWKIPSLFQEDQIIRFFPRPPTWPSGIPHLPDERKAIKRIEWLSENVFRAWLNGENLSVHWEPKRNLVQGGRIWLSEEEWQQVAGWRDEDSNEILLWALDDVPRVTVDRQTSASAVYQTGIVRFQPGGGLWFLACWREDWQERGEVGLRILGDAGIGGERSAGYGLFHLHGPFPSPSLPTPQAGGLFLTLSLYFPTEEELPAVLKEKQVSYRLCLRRGWMSSPEEVPHPDGKLLRGSALRRRAVRMFAEGSVLYWPEGKTTLGMLADVTPQAFHPAQGNVGHKVWRYGYALPVGYKGGER